MPDYLVTWTIEIDASTPESAASQARDMQLDPENIATFFTVKNLQTERVFEIELQEL